MIVCAIHLSTKYISKGDDAIKVYLIRYPRPTPNHARTHDIGTIFIRMVLTASCMSVGYSAASEDRSEVTGVTSSISCTHPQ